jgi:Ca2+-binding RTX toxin-like protein
MKARGRAAVALAVFGVGMSVPAAASAWTVSLSGTALTAVAAPGETNQLDLRNSAGGIALSDDSGAGLTGAIPSGCTNPDPQTLLCGPGVVTAAAVFGGDGGDTLSNESTLSTVTLDGGSGNDTVFGGSGPDTLAGGDGDDVVYGGGGNDVLDGGNGNDVLSGGDGNDTVGGGAGDDQLQGGTGADTLTGADGNDTIQGGEDNDALDGGAGDDTVIGGSGDDRIAGGIGNDRLDGGDGNDALDGGAGNDVLSGGDGINRLAGGDGSDTLTAGPSGDALDGGPGDDVLNGGDGTDTLTGDDGNDTLASGAGNDHLDGGDGGDTLNGGPGADTMLGGAGIDTATYAASATGVAVTLDDQANDGAGGEGDDVASDVENVVGSASGDTLIGSAAPDRLDGGTGDDTLDGGPGPDVLVGGDGTDTVTYAGRTAVVRASIGDGQPSGEAAEGDLIDSSVENLIGGSGNDTLSGASEQANVISGGPGNDTIRLADDLDVADRALCGAGTDTVLADRIDTYDGNCEKVGIGGQPVRPARPRVFVGNRMVLLHGGGYVLLAVQCASGPAACSGTLRFTTHSSATGTTLGRGTFHTAAASQGLARVFLRHRALVALRRRGSTVRLYAHIRLHEPTGPPTQRRVAMTLRLRRR